MRSRRSTEQKNAPLNQDGVILLTTVIIMMVMLTFGLALAEIILKDLSSERDLVNSQKAFNTAEQGLQEALLKIKNSSADLTNGLENTTGNYHYKIDKPSGGGSGGGFDGGEVWGGLGNGLNISNTPTSDSQYPDLAKDSSGNLHVVWQELVYYNNNYNTDILYSKFNGSYWSTPVNISNSINSSTAPQIQIDSAGNLHVAWMDYATAKYNICYTVFNGSSWSTPVNSSVTNGCSSNPQIQLDFSGNPHVMWCDNYDILYSKLSGSSWSTPVNISHNTGNSYYHQIQIDSAGNPHAVWRDDSDGNSDILYSKFTGSSWSTPVNISHDSGYSEKPQIKIDSSGSLHVVWENSVPGNYDIFYSKFSGSSWLAKPVNISRNTGNSYSHQIQIDSSGNPHVVWRDYTPGNQDIYYSKSDGSIWSIPENISHDSGNSENPQIQIDSSGNPHVVWVTSTNGNDEIFYSEFDGSRWGFKYDIISHNSLSKPLDTPLIELDASNKPNIAWLNNAAPNCAACYVGFSRWNGNYWQTLPNPSQSTTKIQNYDFKIRKSDNIPFIAWSGSPTGATAALITKWNPALNSGAGGWSKMDGTAGYDMISTNDSVGKISLDFDLNGNPIVAWEDASTGNGDIYVSRYSPAATSTIKWTKMDGSVFTKGSYRGGWDIISYHNSRFSPADRSGVSTNPRLKTDSTGNPHVVWEDDAPGVPSIFYSKFDGALWSIPTNINNKSSYSMSPHIQIDSAGNPHVVWCDTGYYDIFHSKFNGTSWSIPTNISKIGKNGNAYTPRIQIDMTGTPHVAWYEGIVNGYDILYSRYWGEGSGGSSSSTQYTVTVTGIENGVRRTIKVKVATKADGSIDTVTLI